MATEQDRLQKLAQDYAIAWSSGDPQAVAAFYSDGAELRINGGDPLTGRAEISSMVKRFHTDFPDLEWRCDLMRKAGPRGLFVWTLEGTHDKTGNHVQISGWEDWQLDGDLSIRSSAIWFDDAEYQRKIDGG